MEKFSQSETMNGQRLNGQQEQPLISDETVKLDISIDLNDDPNDGAARIIKSVKPLWTINKIRFKIFTDGCTNKLIGCFHSSASGAAVSSSSNANHVDEPDASINGNEVVLVRIYGKNTEVLIDRKREISNFKLLHSFGFAPRLLATFENGIVYEYCEGKPLTKQQLSVERVWRAIARRMAEMHRRVRCPFAETAQPMLWPKFRQLFDLIPATFSDPAKQMRREKLLPTLAQLETEFQQLYNVLNKIDSPVVFAHNDLLLGNILVDEKTDEVRFIDYEYAAYNYQAYDIGNHFAEFAGMTDVMDYTYYPSKEYQLNWLREYLTHYYKDSGKTIGDADVVRLYAHVNKFALAAHLFWCLWAHNQAEYSEIDYDFIEFAQTRFNEYSAKKEQFLAL